MRPNIDPRAVVAFNYEEWLDKCIMMNLGPSSKDRKEDARNAIDWEKENEESDKHNRAMNSVLAINGGTIKSSQSAVHALLTKDSKRKAAQIQGWPSPKRKKMQDLYWKCSPQVLKDLNYTDEIIRADVDPSRALPVGRLGQSLNSTIEDVTAGVHERRSYAKPPCSQVGVTGNAEIVSQSYGSGQQQWRLSRPHSHQSNGIPPERRRPHPMQKDLAHGMPKDLVNMQNQLSAAAQMNMQVKRNSLSHITGQSHHLPKQPGPHRALGPDNKARPTYPTPPELDEQYVPNRIAKQKKNLSPAPQQDAKAVSYNGNIVPIDSSSLLITGPSLAFRNENLQPNDNSFPINGNSVPTDSNSVPINRNSLPINGDNLRADNMNGNNLPINGNNPLSNGNNLLTTDTSLRASASNEQSPAQQRRGKTLRGDRVLPELRCMRCRRSKKGCDGMRPCQRCKDAGVAKKECYGQGERIAQISSHQRSKGMRNAELAGEGPCTGAMQKASMGPTIVEGEHVADGADGIEDDEDDEEDNDDDQGSLYQD